MEIKRCFIALDLSRQAINYIKEVQKILKKQKLFDGKLVEPENLHLTLKFLREIDDNKIEEVKKRLREIKFNDFEAELSGIGVFSSQYKNYIRVVWIKLNNCFELQKKIDESLEDLFSVENRFMSHITIVRVKRVYDKKSFLDYIKDMRIKKIKFKVDKFFLKKSELFESGPVYEDLGVYNSVSQ